MIESKDKKEFAKRLIAMGELWDKELSRTVMNIYWEALKNYAIEDIISAFNYLGKNSRYFPRPADFVEAIDGDSESRASVAWATLLMAIEIHGRGKSVRFDDQAIMSAVNAMGGWIEVCQRPDLQYKRKDFVNIYLYFERNGQGQPEYLTGQIEAENRIRGYPDQIPESVVVRTIGKSHHRQITDNGRGAIEAPDHRNSQD